MSSRPFGAGRAGHRAMSCHVDLDGVISHVDDAWTAWGRRHGTARDYQWVGTSYLAACEGCTHDPTVAEVLRLLGLALSGDLLAERSVLTPCAATGTSGWFDMRIRSRFRPDDTCVGAAISFTECTSLERLTDLVRLFSDGEHSALEDLNLQLVLNSIPEPIALLDEEYVVTLTNTYFDTMFEENRTVIGSHIAALWPSIADQVPKGPAPRESSADNSGCTAAWLERGNGERFPASISTSPLSRGDRRLTLAVVRDLTECYELEQTTERLKEEVLGTLSHEFLTPLTSIIGYTDLLDAELAAGEGLGNVSRDWLEVIKRNARRELQLIDDFLTLAQLRDQTKPLSWANIDLVQLIRQRIDSVDESARAKGVCVTVVSTGPCVVWGDLRRLSQLLDKVLSNAVKFSTPGGAVTVTVSSDGPHVVMDVTDDGPGIREDEKSLVFDALYRGSFAVQQHTPGAGMGLAIVKAVVEAHNGGLEVLSGGDGQGTCMRMVLPVKDPAPGVSASSATRPSHHRDGRARLDA